MNDIVELRHQEATRRSEAHVRGKACEAANSRLNGRHRLPWLSLYVTPALYLHAAVHVHVNTVATEAKEFPGISGRCLERYFDSRISKNTINQSDRSLNDRDLYVSSYHCKGTRFSI